MKEQDSKLVVIPEYPIGDPATHDCSWIPALKHCGNDEWGLLREPLIEFFMLHFEFKQSFCASPPSSQYI